VVPSLQQLLSIRGDYPNNKNSSAALAPPLHAVSNITIRGIGFRDSAPSFLEPHGIPSGGDWSLQRSAAVFLEGTSGISLHGCKFKYLGGLGYMVSGYNRAASITQSEFA
jgi:hypothetical protein